MNNQIILSLIAFLLVFSVSAQSGFRTLATKGTVQYSQDGEWKSVIVGKTLPSLGELKLGGNAYISLLYKNGKSLELKGAGTHQISKLAEKVDGTNESISSKYAEFVMAEMSKDKDDVHSDHRKNMGVTGSVERASDNAEIALFLPKFSNLYGDEIVLNWAAKNESSTYKILVTDMFEQVIAEREAEGNTTMLDVSKLKLDDGAQFLVRVFSPAEGASSRPHRITLVEKDRKKELEEELEMINKEIGSDLTATNHLILASFYEQNEMLADAILHYQKAIELQPDVDGFIVAYNSFLQRHNI